MQTTKQEVVQLLNRLPDDCSLEDIQYHLYVMQKSERGLPDAGKGSVYTREQMEEKLSRRIRK
jgi:hypothetical protein